MDRYKINVQTVILDVDMVVVIFIRFIATNC